MEPAIFTFKKPILLFLLFLTYFSGIAQNKSIFLNFYNTDLEVIFIDSIIIFQKTNSVFEKYDSIYRINSKDTISYKIPTNTTLKFEFYFLKQNSIEKYFKTDTLQNKQLISINLTQKLIKLKEIEVIARRDRFIQSGDTTLININDNDTRPQAAASTLFGRINGLENQFGGITVLGKGVQEVTIDNRKIYGGDPNLSLEAIKANMIDQMEFVEKVLPSGGTINSLNVKLKADKRNLGYGNIGGGIGMNGAYLANANFSKMAETSFLNMFFTTNNINQRGLDSKSLENINVRNLKNSMNRTGSVIGLYDREKVEENTFLQEINQNLNGINKNSDFGVNYNVNKSKIELDILAFGNILNGNISQFKESISTLSDINLNAQKTTSQENTNKKLISNINLTWKPTLKTNIRVGNFTHLKASNNLWSDSTSSKFSNATESGNQLTNSNKKINYSENQFNISITQKGKKPGVLSSLLFKHNQYFATEKNVFENTIFANDVTIARKYNQTFSPNNYQGGLQLNTSKPINRRILLESKIKVNYDNFSNDLANNKIGFQADSSPIASAYIKNKTMQTGIYALYQKGSFKLISGLNYNNWNIARENNNSTYTEKRNFLMSPFFKVEFNINKNPFWIRYSNEQILPNWSQTGVLPDSSNLNAITNGNIFLDYSIQRGIESNYNFSFTGGFRIGIGAGYKTYINPIINENFINPQINISATSFLNYSQPNSSFNVIFSAFRIKLKSNFSFFYFANFIHFESYQKTENTFNLLKTNILFSNISTTYKLNKNVAFRGNMVSNISWLNNNLVSNNSLIFSGDISFGKNWYLDSKVNFNINKQAGYKYKQQSFVDLEMHKYMLKKNNLKTTIFIKNLFDVRNLISVNQSTNYQSVRYTNFLPRVIGFSLTYYPEF